MPNRKRLNTMEKSGKTRSLQTFFKRGTCCSLICQTGRVGRFKYANYSNGFLDIRTNINIPNKLNVARVVLYPLYVHIFPFLLLRIIIKIKSRVYEQYAHSVGSTLPPCCTFKNSPNSWTTQLMRMLFVRWSDYEHSKTIEMAMPVLNRLLWLGLG